MLGAMSVVCAGLFILIKSNIIAHGALTCIIVVAGVLAGVYTLTPHNTTRYLYISKLHNTSCTHEGSYVYGGRMGGVHSILELNAYIYYCNSSFYILKGPNKNIK